jgi:RNA polymerase sigma-70 factor (ECF subfamily)
MYATENKQVNIWRWIGGRRAFCCRARRQDNMPAPEEHVGSEHGLTVLVHEKGTQEMQEVLSRYRPAFYRKAYQYLGNAADAEDAVQDALLSAYKNLDQFKGEAQMSTWLTAIVINCARMHLRRRPRQAPLSLDERFGDEEQYCASERLADSRPSPEDKCRESELRRHLLQFITELSPSLRKAFELRDLDELTTSEAADILGVAEGTVKAQVSRARAKLRRLMSRALGRRPSPTPTCTVLPTAEKKRQKRQVSDECAPALSA